MVNVGNDRVKLWSGPLNAEAATHQSFCCFINSVGSEARSQGSLTRELRSKRIFITMKQIIDNKFKHCKVLFFSHTASCRKRSVL